MPLYEYKCSCGYTGEHWNKMDEYEPCPTCKTPMQRVLGGYKVISDLEPYLDPHIGPEPTWVKSKQHRKELMKKFGVSEIYGKGWR